MPHLLLQPQGRKTAEKVEEKPSPPPLLLLLLGVCFLWGESPRKQARLKSAIVVPETRKLSVFNRLSKGEPGAPSSIWQEVKPRFWWRQGRAPLPATASRRPTTGVIPAWRPFNPATLGRCLRCLAQDHKIADCRDPPRCYICKRSGHISSGCPSKYKNKPSIFSCIYSTHPAPPSKQEIPNPLAFPPLTGHKAPVRERLGPKMDYIPGLPENHPACGYAVVVADAAMEHEAMRLYNHGAVIKARLPNYDVSAKEMAQALQQQVGTPNYDVRRCSKMSASSTVSKRTPRTESTLLPSPAGCGCRTPISFLGCRSSLFSRPG